MINVENLPKAYTEVTEILKYVSKKDLDKIPKNIINLYERKRDKEYKYEVIHFDNFGKQEMLYETQAILAIIFREYWANDGQRKRIKLNEQYQLQQLEEEKREKYNPDDVFKNNKEIKQQEVSLVEVKSEKWYEKFLRIIKTFFLRK